MTRDDIFDQVATISNTDLVGYISQGLVTLDELCDYEYTRGDFANHRRGEIRQLLQEREESDWQNAQQSIELLQQYCSTHPNSPYISEAYERIQQIQDQAIWEEVDKDDIDALEEFLRANPNSSYIEAARERIDWLEEAEDRADLSEEIEGKLDEILKNRGISDKAQESLRMLRQYQSEPRFTDIILSLIERDHKAFSSKLVYQLLDSRIIRKRDLSKLGIPDSIIDATKKNTTTVELPASKPLNSVSRPSTEFYFWGLPSTGKTCAIGAILRSLAKGKLAIYNPLDCQGMHYRTELGNIFRFDPIILPGGTPVQCTYEIAFDLITEKGEKHPITCIDLAGEVLTSIYDRDVKGEELNDDQKNTLRVIQNLLVNNSSNSQKIHFFVLEYSEQIAQYGNGLTTSVDYLIATLKYLERTKIFEKLTDKIYLLVTKSDRIESERIGDREEKIRKIITDPDGDYWNLYQLLKQICKDNSINGGKVGIIPFSLGKVYFNQYCVFNPTSSEHIVKLMLEHTKAELKKGFFSR